MLHFFPFLTNFDTDDLDCRKIVYNKVLLSWVPPKWVYITGIVHLYMYIWLFILII